MMSCQDVDVDNSICQKNLLSIFVVTVKSDGINST